MNESEFVIAPTVLTREYNAPIQLVFDAWTKVEHIQNWQFPFKGFKCEFLQSDIKPDGKTLHKMIAPNGFEMWLLTKYEEISEPTRIVFRQYNSNEHGDILPHPKDPNWPREMRTTIELAQTETNTTRLTLFWQPIDASDKEAEVFEATRSDHENGWGSGLNELQDYLSTL